MTPSSDALTFVSDAATYTVSDAFIARMPLGISDRSGLFDALYQALDLPGYFGFNFDALHDCLRNFFWVSQPRVVLIHQELPNIKEELLAVYLDLLCTNCQERSCDDKERTFRAVFPTTSKTPIDSVLARFAR